VTVTTDRNCSDDHVNVGPRYVVVCGIVQYSVLWGSMVGYTITTATSIM
jgi:hypothetical protein